MGSLALLGVEDAALTGAPLPAVRPAGRVDAMGQSVQSELAPAKMLGLVQWLWTRERAEQGAGKQWKWPEGQDLLAEALLGHSCGAPPSAPAALLPQAAPPPSRGWGSSSLLQPACVVFSAR